MATLLTPSKPPIDFRAAERRDLDVLHDLNSACAPNVGDVTREELSALVQKSVLTLLATEGARVLGFALCLTEGADYASLNYRWLSARYPTFLYIDRIAVVEGARSLGVGGALYGELFREFAGKRPVALAEVNLAPPNPRSLKFHQREGFAPVGERWSDDRSKGVVYLARALAPDITTR